MKYIFVAGAPGSKWSSVVKNIYYSDSIDRSDYTDQRTYYHDASGTRQLMHLGVYFDPGMEYGGFFDKLSDHSREQCEAEFDRPFSGTGVRIIKSHVFSHHIDFIRRTWTDCPIVLVLGGDDACLGWWVRCGHFDITYPNYAPYYKNLRDMGHIINQQNHDLRQAWQRYSGICAGNNEELAAILRIKRPPREYQQDYGQSNIEVKVI